MSPCAFTPYPTRRSSDLLVTTGPIIALVRARQWRFATGRDASRPDRLEVTWADLVDVGPGERVLLVDPGHRRAEAALRDRKSTRLNSSHLVSSYAVFCLK